MISSLLKNSNQRSLPSPSRYPEGPSTNTFCAIPVQCFILAKDQNSNRPLNHSFLTSFFYVCTEVRLVREYVPLTHTITTNAMGDRGRARELQITSQVSPHSELRCGRPKRPLQGFLGIADHLFSKEEILSRIWSASRFWTVCSVTGAANRELTPLRFSRWTISGCCLRLCIFRLRRMTLSNNRE